MPIMTKAGYVPPKDTKQKPDRKNDQKRKPRKKRRGKRRKGIGTAGVVSLVLFFIALAIGAATIYIYVQTQPYAQAFLPGVALSGYPLGGATWENASALVIQQTKDEVDQWQYALTYNGKTYALGPQDVALTVDENATLEPLWQIGRTGGMVRRFVDMMKLRREGVSGEIQITYDMTAVDALLEQIRAEVEREPVDATIRFSPGNSEPFRFTDDGVGYALDTAPLRAQIEQAVASLISGTANVQPQVLEPSVTREELEKGIYLRARVRMTLLEDEGARNNATIAARMLNGVRIDPGQTRSFNEIVGSKLEESGYVTAPEPAFGPYAEGVGGGVCQTSTALYRAALLGDVTVSERNAAAYPMTGFCQAGQEAAVSDQGLDLTLTNDTAAPMFITARVFEQSESWVIEVQIMGLALEHRYELVSEAAQGESIEEPLYYRDRDGEYATYTDEHVPVHEGLPGWEATTIRQRIDGEGNVIDEQEISKDSYAPVAPVIYVGVTPR